ncbi:MAG: CCA tRNA nucleotidyltransferase [Rhodoplanes sp.]
MTQAEATQLHVGWLTTEPLADVLAALNGDGEEARIVGGAVRNALLGEPPGDIDLATTATPEEVTRRAHAAGFKAVPTGVDHGTVTIVAHGHPFEVTTLREDVETFGRKAKVAFGRDWRADAERRDFTMNALSLSADGTVHDYVGGLSDLKARRVRFIGDPAKRIAEDYLRILRFFRFHALYGDGDSDCGGLHACIAGRAGLRELSRERVRMELFKLLVAPLAAPTLTNMSDAGLLQLVLGGVAQLASMDGMVRIEAAIGAEPDAARRLGALAVLIEEDADRLSERLRLSNVEHRRLHAMAEGWRHLSPAISEQDRRALLYRLGAELFTDRVLLAWARSGASVDDAGWQALVNLPRHWAIPAFPLRAAEFIARGVAKGPALGAAMKAAEEAWIAAGFPDTGAEIEAIATKIAEPHRPKPPS